MVSFPPCKINLGLNVIRKRQDGYHTIETCFYPVPWTDILEIIPSDQLVFSSTGIAIQGLPEDNLCMKAYSLLKAVYNIPAVSIHLHKIIPMGAGLGGGSSDGAYALQMLNTIFKLQLSLDELKGFALRLGSDCAFFIDEKPMLGKGRGEDLTPVAFTLKHKFLVIVKPDVSVSTAQAYAGVVPLEPVTSISEIIKRPIEEWKGVLENDFEVSVFSAFPQIGGLKKKMISLGASYAAMSGSGSSVYGIFEKSFPLPAEFTSLHHWSGVLE
jgi:4-diphosphocytidyl-2-C-methyl-D-erythritol kinase